MKREKPPARRAAETIPFEIEGYRYLGWTGRAPNGQLIELWLRSAKPGSTMDVLASEAGIMASLLLQGGMDPKKLRDSLSKGPVAKLLSIILE